MKTHTHTSTTYTIPGTEIEVELPYKPDSIMDFKEPLVRITDDEIILGYLVHDPDCANPLEDCDGMGAIYEARRHGSTLSDYEKALGLADGGPDLGLVDEDAAVEEAVRRILADKTETARAADYCRQHWDQPDGRGDDRFVEDCLDSLNELAPIFDTDALLREMWEEGRKNGTIGSKYAVMLDVYEHGQVKYSLSGQGMQCRWDTARAGATWVPDQCCLEHIESYLEAERMAEAQKCAKAAAEEYTNWCNGECYGVVVVTYDEAGAQLSEDACWGYVGGDYAYETLVSEFPKEDEDCAQGLHSWIDETGKLPADTRCTRCGALYGNPD